MGDSGRDAGGRGRRRAMRPSRLRPGRVLAWALVAWPALACTPEVVVKPPERIVIDMNVKIDHRVRVEVEKDLDREMQKKEDAF